MIGGQAVAFSTAAGTKYNSYQSGWPTSVYQSHDLIVLVYLKLKEWLYVESRDSFVAESDLSVSQTPTSIDSKSFNNI